MSGQGISLWVAGAWILGLLLACAGLLGVLWLRLRRIRLQVEARYLSAVAGFAPGDHAATMLAGVGGEPVRRLLQGLVSPGVTLGPLSWHSRGWVRYDSDDRERAVSAETYYIPGRWWAQIRRVRLRWLGWIDEIHEIEAGRVSSAYWWLGLYRVDRPGRGPSPLALEAQQLGEAVLAPWSWFVEGVAAWEATPADAEWQGRVTGTGHGLRLRLDATGRPASLDLLDAQRGERVRVEYGGWRWCDRCLLPSRLRLIENVGTVNEFVRLDVQVDAPTRAPGTELRSES
jgi:predicted outer membrane lipoprotein